MIDTRAILPTYATRYGSTQEVAEVITAELRESGLDVDIEPLPEVKMLDKHDTLVLGAAMC